MPGQQDKLQWLTEKLNQGVIGQIDSRICIIQIVTISYLEKKKLVKAGIVMSKSQFFLGIVKILYTTGMLYIIQIKVKNIN